MGRKLLVLILLCTCILSRAQEKVTLSGYIRDKETGEELIGATVYLKEQKKGLTTNLYGFYSLVVPQGKHLFEISYIGYETYELELDLQANKRLDIELNTSAQKIEEVIVKAKKKDANVESLDISVEKMNIKNIVKLPSFMGEPDVLKAVTLLPGIQTAGEGSAGMYVRGGAADQNLVLLDEATVYNPYHFGGFFSVFNADIVKNMDVFKGGIPAQYGGRLSSLMDIRMKEGNMRKFQTAASIGNIASKATIQGPLEQDRGSFLLSGRRSYFDIFFGLSDDPGVNESSIFFYDLNAKINYKFGENDRVFLSLFQGADRLGFGKLFSIGWTNTTGTLRWNHLFSENLFMNTTLLYSKYDYILGFKFSPAISFDWTSNFSDISLKTDFNYFLSEDVKLNVGAITTHHHFNLREIVPHTGSEIVGEVGPSKNAIESALYAESEHKFTEKFSVRYGLRLPIFNQVGPGEEFNYTVSENFTDETTVQEINLNPGPRELPIQNKLTKYEEFENIFTFVGYEPRFSFKYTLEKSKSVKGSYNRTYQFLHLLTTSNSPTPLDIWVPTTKYIKPQVSDQVAIGYFQNFLDDELEFSSEVYYKHMQNQIDFVDYAQPLFTDNLETLIRTGTAFSTGIELSLKKNEGDLTGAINYTYSYTRRTIPEINLGKEYRPLYDIPHSLNIQAVYKINERWDLGATWMFSSGKTTTFPNGRYEYDGQLAQTYQQGGRNTFRLDPFHRLDLSTNYNFTPRKKTGYRHTLNLSIINAYGRKNPYSLFFRLNAETQQPEAVQLSILAVVVPSLTYSVNF